MPTAAGHKPDSSVPAGDPGTLAFPAAMSQEAFYYLERLQPETSPFNIAVRFRIEGPIDPQILEMAFRDIIVRHESLRTQFEEDQGELLQVVVPEAAFQLRILDLSAWSAPEREAEILRLGTEEAVRPFAMEKAPLMRAELIRMSAEEHILHVTLHHAVSDGWSIGILIDELAANYQAITQNVPAALDPLPIQYPDFAVWQREFLGGPEVEKQLEFWKEKLRGHVEPEFPTDRPRPAVKRWNGDIVSELLPVDLTDRLRTIAVTNGATLFHVFLAAFKILLNRYTGSEDIAIGTPIAGRSRAELEPLIGTFINTVILRSDLSGDPDFQTLLHRIRDTALQALSNQDLPFESLVRALRPRRDAGRNPLFQINFTHQRDFVKPVEFGAARLTAIPSLPSGAIFDLHFFMVERGDVWRASCDFNTDLFDRSTALRFLGHFRTLLESIAAAPQGKVRDLNILTPEETALLRSWSGHAAAYPRDASIGSRFEEMAARYPERTALTCGGDSLTYSELHARSKILAAVLREHGARPGEKVVVLAGSSLDSITAIVAIVFSGAAYVPIDPECPPERLAGLIRDAAPRMVLASPESAALVPRESCPVWIFGRLPEPAAPPAMATQPAALDPAYVMYTSGSTGRPKGVVIPHRAVLRLVCGNDFMDIASDDVFLQAAPLPFDASTFEIWGPLLNGGLLVLPETGANSLDDVARLIRTHRITTLWLTSGLFQVMIDERLDALKGLRNLLAGGDVLPAAHMRRALAGLPGVRLINGYGPTENTTFTACHTITAEDLERETVPIGKPIANTTVWILDHEGRPAPLGVPGGLFAGGDGLALGYLNNDALTRERFVSSPVPGQNGERLYATGDRARWRSDGTIEFLGRDDRQIKVRGFRIEPAEIESVLSALPGIGQCLVGAHGTDAGSKSLVAWIAPLRDHRLERTEIKARLTEKLPAHLVPDAIVFVDAFPLTPNGKIDRDALPAPGETGRPPSAPPETQTEKSLAAIWEDLLGIRTIGRDDDFFDLGGHSLLGLRMFSRLRAEFHSSLPLTSLLRAPTIRSLSAVLDREAAGENLDEACSILAPIQPAGDRLPFFCVHGGDGGVLFYRNLAEHLDHDRPLYAIEAPALSLSGEIRIGAVESIAAEYLKLIRQRQSQGPYHLGGYSFGGVVAYEMARQLKNEGEDVAFLALFDTMSPAAPGSPYNALERLIKFWNAQTDTGFAGRIQRLAQRLCERAADRIHDATGLFPTRANTPPAAHNDSRIAELCNAHLEVMRAYTPGPYPGRLTLFKTPDVDDIYEFPEDYGWGPLAEQIEIIIVPGRHLTLFDRENVGILGRELRRILQLLQ